MTTKLTTAALALTLAFGLTAAAQAGNGNHNGGHRNIGHAGFQNRGFQNHQFKQNHNFQNHNFQQKFHVQPQHNFNRHVHVPQFKHQHVGFNNYHLTHGKKFNFGYAYYGKTHGHWQTSIFSQDYGCNIHYCPCTSAWYYWCQPHGCYYPVTYCPTGTYAY